MSITNLGRPEIDGREAARRVKQAAETTPSMRLTGWGQHLQAEESLPLSVDYLLSKPLKITASRNALTTGMLQR